ncbi:hypothetical protein IFM89_004708 [Coptis chinensis]|uniref:Rho termination factor-like N-terminal domain-containing protein n=1 Tax=Coptis chinensis TaxID=261450 RepID=A0A835GUC9_9MAGN|nr:hypothetical protein IFM89_004708 [Coptis chinensis]
MNAAAGLVSPIHGIYFPKFSTFSKSNLLLLNPRKAPAEVSGSTSHISDGGVNFVIIPKMKYNALLLLNLTEITDGAPSFASWPVHPTFWSVRCEGNNRKGRPRRSSTSGQSHKPEENQQSSQSSDEVSSISSNSEDIIALFRRIQSSIAKDGSGGTKKRSFVNNKKMESAESVLDVLRQSRNQIRVENKASPKRRGASKTKGKTGDISPTSDFKLTRPPSYFVKKSPIPRPSTLKGQAIDVANEDSLASSVRNDPDSHKIEDMKLSELKELAKSRGMKGYSKLKKGELIALLKG